MKVKTIGIYMIISPTARVYIGQSVDIDKRKVGYNRIKCTGQARLYNSFNKYGINSHLFEIIELCSEAELNEKERHWQDIYEVLGKYGLNCNLTKSTDKSGKQSDETINKISQKLTGRIFTAEHRKNMSAAQKAKKYKRTNYTHSEETRQKISKAHTGRKVVFSDEHRRNLSKVWEKRRLSSILILFFLFNIFYCGR